MASVDQELVIQTLTRKVRRLERVNSQLASNYKLIKETHQRLVKELRDAEAYIQVLEHESSMWRQQYEEVIHNDGEVS